MNTDIEAIKKLQQDVFELKERDDELSKVLEGLKIDKQLYLRANEKIRPGIGCKVAYDENGLILSQEELDESDIPKLAIDKIEGLRDALFDKASRKDLRNISVNLEEIFQARDIAGTGCKVNYDRYGVIQSVADLTREDIPKLSLDHIEGLNEILEDIRSSIPKNVRVDDHKVINPGSGTKVTYDEHGHITGSSNIDMNDIPMEIITKLNELESLIPSLASSKTLESINKTLSKKIDKDGNVEPGTYTKVTINRNGIVTRGSEMTVNDLPEISIEDIKGLYEALKSKAEHSTVIELMNSVSILMGYMNKIGDLTSIKNKVDKMVTESTIAGMMSDMNELRRAISSINSTDINMIIREMESLRKDLSDISGRITVIEQKLQN